MTNQWKMWGLLFLTTNLCSYNFLGAGPYDYYQDNYQNDYMTNYQNPFQNNTQGNSNSSCWEAFPNVYLSKADYSFDFEIKGLYLQPSSSNLEYAAEATPIPAPSPSWKIYDVRPDYNGAFEIGVSGILHDRNSKIKLNWEHFYSKDSSSINVNGTTDMVGPFFEIGPDALPYTFAKGRKTFHFDSVNLNYGILVNFGDKLRTNMYAGLGFAYIKEINHSRFSNASGTIARTITTPSRFWGIGPEFGVESCFSIWKGIQFNAGASTSLLIGELKNHTNFTAVSPALIPLGITPPNDQSTTTRNTTQVVPAFKGKLGMSYEYSYCNSLFGNLKFCLEAGYQAEVYLNAIQTLDIGSEVITPPVAPDTVGVFARTFNKTVSNFALAGPYLNLNVAF